MPAPSTLLAASTVLASVVLCGCFGPDGGCSMSGVELGSVAPPSPGYLILLHPQNSNESAALNNSTFVLFSHFIGLTPPVNRTLRYAEGANRTAGLFYEGTPLEFRTGGPSAGANYSFQFWLTIASNDSGVRDLLLFGGDNRVEGYFLVSSEGTGFTPFSNDFAITDQGGRHFFTIVDNLRFWIHPQLACA